MNIGPSVFIKGSVTAGEDFSVAGRVEGEIRLQAGTLTLASGCTVKGEAAAPSIVVEGMVDGNVVAAKRAEVRAGAVVAGSITTATLVIAEGAQLNCRIEMPAAAPKPAEAAPAVVPAGQPAVAV
jgi:cytoskeletal protein CcmA (bactofilin family)